MCHFSKQLIPNIWVTFIRRFEAKVFQKQPNLVTLYAVDSLEHIFKKTKDEMLIVGIRNNNRSRVSRVHSTSVPKFMTDKDEFLDFEFKILKIEQFSRCIVLFCSCLFRLDQVYPQTSKRNRLLIAYSWWAGCCIQPQRCICGADHYTGPLAAPKYIFSGGLLL